MIDFACGSFSHFFYSHPFLLLFFFCYETAVWLMMYSYILYVLTKANYTYFEGKLVSLGDLL